MLENIANFFKMVGVNLEYPVMIVVLLFLKCMVPKKLEYRVEETKKEDGSSKFDIYKIF